MAMGGAIVMAAAIARRQRTRAVRPKPARTLSTREVAAKAVTAAGIVTGIVTGMTSIADAGGAASAMIPMKTVPTPKTAAMATTTRAIVGARESRKGYLITWIILFFHQLDKFRDLQEIHEMCT